jgi:hypothetical protein
MSTQNAVSPILSKSRYLAGLQGPKPLGNQVNAPDERRCHCSKRASSVDARLPVVPVRRDKWDLIEVKSTTPEDELTWTFVRRF